MPVDFMNNNLNKVIFNGIIFIKKNLLKVRLEYLERVLDFKWV